MKALAWFALLSTVALSAQTNSSWPGRHSWCVCGGTAHRTVVFENGRLYSQSWIDASNGRDLQKGLKPAEFSIKVGDEEVSSMSRGWSLITAHEQRTPDGSNQLELTLRRAPLEVNKVYVSFPGSSVIREWASFKNIGSASVTLSDPHFLDMTARLGNLDSDDLDWLTGGENQPGSWLLKTETLSAGRARNFDSYDPFPGIKASKYEFKMGSATYAPWFALYDRDSRLGVVAGFDYFGHWTASFTPDADQSIGLALKVAGYHQSVAPGVTVKSPMAFTAMFRGDLDDAGNELLDWQYQYLWDNTRSAWFPAIRMLGWWWNGTPWKDPGNSWVGGNGDAASAFRKVFRVSDLMSEVGGDVYHRDWGWWDHAGDWDGPDFKTMGAYLQKHGMGQLIYAFIYTVDARSRVAREHPDWVFKETLDMSNPVVVRYLQGQLDEFANRFGPFEWRNDSTPTAPHGNDDTPLLGQDQGFRTILQTFLQKHPDCAFQGVNGGGNDTGYDYAHYASSISFSDGAVGILRNYWASLILPPDKSSDIPDNWQPDRYDKGIWRGLLTINFDMTGDTWNPEKLEGLRLLIDIYHYLEQVGLVGRWVHVYRPVVQNDDPTLYFERLSRDAERGVIILKHPAPRSVSIRPKGLKPTEKYLVSYQESSASEWKTGAELMQSGITLHDAAPGELIYLNVPYYPGSSLYRKPPSAPSGVRKSPASNMGYAGVEIRWQPAHDDQWLSYYEVARDGVVIDKVAKGTYYFDHSAGGDPSADYSVRAVNGGGLQSPFADAAGPSGKRETILDDTSPSLSYVGKWTREQQVQPAFAGTLASSSDADATVEFTALGSGFVWFTRLCGECGEAEISIDGHPGEQIDTYSADDIFGVGIYSKTFASKGSHTIRITNLGKHGGVRGKGTRLYIDGFRVDP